MSTHPLNATDADFAATVLQSEIPVLVDLWAPWCGPCRMMTPVLDELAGDYAGRVKVVKVNVDQNPATAQAYKVRSIPLLLLFKDGQVVANQLGATGKAQLQKLLDGALAA